MEDEEMNILIFGESCTGKSTLAKMFTDKQEMELLQGKDYLRLAKNPAEALKLLVEKLTNDDSNLLYVSTELDQVKAVPENVYKIYVKGQLETIKERFAQRMNGNLPKGVEIMLERKHGMFDNMAFDLVIEDITLVDIDELLQKISK